MVGRIQRLEQLRSQLLRLLRCGAGQLHQCRALVAQQVTVGPHFRGRHQDRFQQGPRTVALGGVRRGVRLACAECQQREPPLQRGLGRGLGKLLQ